MVRPKACKRNDKDAAGQGGRRSSDKAKLFRSSVLIMRVKHEGAEEQQGDRTSLHQEGRIPNTRYVRGNTENKARVFDQTSLGYITFALTTSKNGSNSPRQAITPNKTTPATAPPAKKANVGTTRH